ncbi:MAG: C25 family cysteine peptidase, partial [Bacteroidota bacterium]
YPFILANSCLAGDIHQTGSSVSEEWVLEPEKGSIGFLATIDQSYDYTLHGYSSELYKNIAYKNYGKPIGDCIKNTIKIYQALGVFGSHLINTCMEFTLHGDPAVILNSFDLPDLIAGQSNIKTIPTYVSTEIDSFDVRVVITNTGRATTDTFIVAVTRTLPGGDTLSRLVEIHGCFFTDTFTVRFPVDKINGIGINSICVDADAEGWVAEFSELNNSACLNFSIYSGDLIPVWPYEFAIYPNNTVILKASTGNPFITSQTSIFQIDTTDLFNSPVLDSIIITHPGGVVEWPVPITLTDSTVYFWRVSKLPAGTDDYNWKESSFIYINGRTGWSQAHHFQFKKDTYQYIVYDKPGRKFDYINTPVELYCHTNSWGSIDVAYYLNSVKIDYSCCYPYSSMLVVVIDPETLIPWTSDRNDYGHVDYPKCYSRIRPDNYFVFWVDSASLENMATLIRDTVPDGHYILLYNYGNGNYPNWPPGAVQAVNNLGGSQVQLVPSGYPYIFFCQKGDPSSAQEEIGSSASSVVDLNTSIPTNFIRGNITSTVIGPSNYWQTLHWRQTPSESMSEDSVSLTINGVRLSGQDTLLMTIPFDTTDIYDLFNTIPGSEYPYLVMNLFSYDDSTRTPAQLKKWQLTFEEMPETAINPSLGYSFHKDTVQEGEDITFIISTENISSHNMDSLLVTYMHQDRNNNLHLVATKRLKKHPSGDVITDTVSMNTIGYGGLNSIWVEFNPINNNTGYYDQLEQYHFNNIAQRFFYVQSDITNPVLDVTFDGFHILDGDIISAKPEIIIQLKDENKYLALNDPGLFRVYLTRPGSDQEELIPFTDSIGNEILKWTPANLPHNSCKIEYSPVLTTDGIYQLRVGATDASSNESGDIDYKISFEVINKPSITNIFNYPNPFSTSTRFVFELTGSEIPSDLQIKIFTVTGKLVKVLYLEDLGNVHVGRNISEYAWDGRDMFGDQLANGVYFFVVTAQIDGLDIEKRDTQTDQYFKKGVGKMYLMR